MSKQRSAYWIHRDHLFRKDEYLCSACKYRAEKALGTCPGCGARMKRSKYDPVWVDELEMLDAIFDD